MYDVVQIKFHAGIYPGLRIEDRPLFRRFAVLILLANFAQSIGQPDYGLSLESDLSNTIQ
jgi:hypothetical protein